MVIEEYMTVDMVVVTLVHVVSRLDERKRRKEFILERGLLNVKRQQALDRKRTKEERELYNRCRVFMRYHSMEEHEALLNGLIAERKLRQRIEELQVLVKANTCLFEIKMKLTVPQLALCVSCFQQE